MFKRFIYVNCTHVANSLVKFTHMLAIVIPNLWQLEVPYINTLWPSDTIWREKSRSTLAQVIAWCLTHQAITWTNIDWTSAKSSDIDIHIGAISQEMPHPSITEICLKITRLKFQSNFPGANELSTLAYFRLCMINTCCLSLWWRGRNMFDPKSIANDWQLVFSPFVFVSCTGKLFVLVHCCLFIRL